MRSKEEAHDYRYFPDPDLLPLVLDEAWVARACATHLPELPDAKRARFVSAIRPVRPTMPAVLVAETVHFAVFFETVAARARCEGLPANWVMGDLFAALNRTRRRTIEQTRPFSAAALGEMLDLMADGTINGRIAKDVFEAMVETGELPGRPSWKRRGLRQVTDTSAIDAAIEAVVAANGDKVAAVPGQARTSCSASSWAR